MNCWKDLTQKNIISSKDYNGLVIYIRWIILKNQKTISRKETCGKTSGGGLLIVAKHRRMAET
jgi:hypothetical protein